MARFESYRGFLFGSLKADVLPLEEHLGDATKVIDLIVDQSPDGLEVLRGASTYTYDGNWKLQTENGADGYHVSSTHWNYAATTARRTAGESPTRPKPWMPATGASRAVVLSPTTTATCCCGWMGQPRGPPAVGTQGGAGSSVRSKRGRIHGQLSRNLCLYPNVYLMDQFSSQIRHFRPISVDQTEVTIYCIAPKGESAEARSNRIRQYEDFFNASGMATPDDLEEFRSCHKTYQAAGAPWNDLSRGVTHQIPGPNDVAKDLGMNRVLSTRSPRPRTKACIPFSTGTGATPWLAAVDAEQAASNRTI